MKSGRMWAKCWGLALTDSGRDPRSSDSLSGSRSFVFFCQVNNAWFHRFPVEQILRHLNTTTSIGDAVKTFETEFWKFYHKGSFSKKNAKIATSGRHNSAVITDVENSLLNDPTAGCLVSIITVIINSKSFLWMVRSAQERIHPQIFRDFRIVRIVTVTWVRCTQPITIDYWYTWHYASSNAVSKTACFTCAYAETKVK